MDLEYARRRLTAGPLRVQAHPGTDAWMSGDRHGEVVKVGRTLVHVRMDRSGKVRRFRPESLEAVIA